ncbi:MAG: O-antigen ligase family protein [Candidatus Omnitrophota bacterium]
MRKNQFIAIGDVFDKLSFFCLIFTLFFLPIYNSYTSIGIGLALFFFLIRILFHFKQRQMFGLNVFLYAFFLVAVISLFYTVDSRESLIGLRKLTMQMVLYLACINCFNTRKRVSWTIFFFIFSAFVVSLDGFYQFMTNLDWFSARSVITYPEWGIKRITASFHEAGALGIYLGTAVSSSWALVFFSDWTIRRKVLLGCVALLITLALILTLAPGAAFGIIAAFLFYVGYVKGWKKLFYLLPLTALSFFLLPRAAIGSFLTTIYGRLYMWKVGLKIIIDHPFLGSGLRTFPVKYQQLCPPGYPFYREGAPYAHNMYIQMISELGLIGFIFFGLFLLKVFSSLVMLSRKTKDPLQKAFILAFLGALITYLTHGCLESSFYTSQGGLLFWFIVGILVSLELINKKPFSEGRIMMNRHEKKLIY